MRHYFYPSDEYEDEFAKDGELATPRDVLLDPILSIEAKRALLSSWASDRRAVENWPSLRRLDNGVEIHIVEILDALRALENGELLESRHSSVVPFPLRERSKSYGDDYEPPAPTSMNLPKQGSMLKAAPSQTSLC